MVFQSKRAHRAKSDADLIVIGLGNPGGQKYHWTRHNVGFWVIDGLLDEFGAVLNETSRHAIWDAVELDDETKVVLAKPTTYMNKSGLAVKELLDKFKLPLEKCLVLVDDLNLQEGQMRFRPTGGHGGHNGLRSILAELGEHDFHRLRLGVGPCPEGWAWEKFVLAQVRNHERERLMDLADSATDAVMMWMREGLVPVMDKFNKRSNGGE